ncbi:unnamed protein product [Fusarium venenatum]|uniref:Uncharacterized protein n=1 Tax=Fusarium venenatum TaxID=56646 RepID=A0A2L2TL97_9HYPO|nr:uncharacterized protein FVRRES_11045 [Fusarium venenatum]CEI70968.1 unnamed protein product [Fusarium venenatum]
MTWKYFNSQVFPHLHLIRRSITHVSKIEFFLAVYAAFQVAMTKNIKGGFRGAGHVPFDPESVISKLDVRLRTPTPAKEEASQAQSWTSRAPRTVLEAQSQSEYLERRVRRHHSSSSESIIEAIKSLTEAVKGVMHESALLRADLQDV